MTRTVVRTVPTPRRPPEAAAPALEPQREGTVRTPRPASEYWDVTEARWRSAR